jgi:hypothetical protein
MAATRRVKAKIYQRDHSNAPAPSCCTLRIAISDGTEVPAPPFSLDGG